MARDDGTRLRSLPGLIRCPRDAAGRVLAIPALERFAEKCTFDATTGCVLWIGGRTAGRGNSTEYGAFWDAGRRHFAHRWAAANIHGLAIDGLQVGHTCPGGRPNPLCVQHVTPCTQLENMAEQIARLGPVGTRATQSNADRQYWLFVSLGLEPAPEAYEPNPYAVPFYEPPEWFRRARPDFVLPELSETPF